MRVNCRRLQPGTKDRWVFATATGPAGRLELPDDHRARFLVHHQHFPRAVRYIGNRTGIRGSRSTCQLVAG